MSNNYGFDFLKSEHRLDEEGQPLAPVTAVVSSTSYEVDDDALMDADEHMARLQEAALHKPDLEKQFDILHFLQKHRSSGCLAASLLYRKTGIDLDMDTNVAAMLRNNPKIRIEMSPDPENPAAMIETYAYQAKYSRIRDKSSLLAQINRMANGVPLKDLVDSYESVVDDVQALITAGDIIAVANPEDKDKILFPRGDDFLVELDGLLSLPSQMQQQQVTTPAAMMNGNGNGTVHYPDDATSMPAPSPRLPEVTVVETDVDPRNQVRRGEAIQVGGQWFRVSSAVKDGPLSEQPAKAQAPLSVVSLADLSRDNEKTGYIRPFTMKQLPLDATLNADSQRNIIAAKTAREKLSKLAHGRSGGVAGQLLLGSHAHASNPVSLASSLSGSAGSNVMRNKRPISKISSGDMLVQSNGHSAAAMVKKEDLEKAASDPALALYGHALRHGCTRDVRELYLGTKDLVPKSDTDLEKSLREHKLLEPGEALRQARLGKLANLDNDGKVRKRRYYERKNQRITNTHLEGTKIGSILALAADEQRQGKTVGDGGM
ncbi:hypothetical protein MPSEU_000084300 [Mayamaea pseudoterrestris]|nr:hypothetical protein MPSEU_000084300 [Mayamaea pseudoterrestris]